MSNTNSWDLGGEGGNSFPFDNIGDSVTGTIESLREVQQTDLQTGEPKTFSNGEPMMMYQVTLATQLRDPANPNDDGHRSVYLKGSRKPETQSSLAAVLAAVKAATGGTALEPNATLTLTYVGNGQQQQRGFNPPKLYSATYVRPVMQLGQPAAPAPVYAPQPVQQAPAQPMPQYVPQPAPAPQSVQQAPVLHAVPAPAPAPAGPAPLSPEQIQALVNAVGVEQVRAMGYQVA